MNSQEFVQQHYRDFDKRGIPNDGGIEYWSHFIDQCTDDACRLREQVHISLGFFRYYRPELFNKEKLADNRRLVAACYLVYLQRPADDKGMTDWLKDLNTYGVPAGEGGIRHIIEAFITSKEYLKRFEPVAVGLSISPTSLSFTAEQGKHPDRQFVTVTSSNLWEFQTFSQKIEDLSTYLVGATKQDNRLAVELKAVGLPVSDYVTPIVITDGVDSLTLQIALHIIPASVGTNEAESFIVEEFVPELPRLATVTRKVSVAEAPFNANPEKSPSANVAAIQAAANIGDVVYLPWQYLTNQVITWPRSGAVVKGDGPTKSGLIHAPHFEEEDVAGQPMFRSPSEGAGRTPTITDITFDNMLFDGRGYKPPDSSGGIGGIGGIGAFSVKRMLLSRLLFKNFAFDAIAILFGNPRAEDVTIRNCTMFEIGRNGMSIGSVQRLLIDRCWIYNCPTQRDGLAAGNGIDFEAESALTSDPQFSLEYLCVQDSIIERDIVETAGAGIVFQPYNTVSNGISRRNAFLRHGWAIQVEGGYGTYPAGFNVRRILSEGDWIRQDAGKRVAGGAAAVYGENLEGGRAVHDVMFRGGVYNGMGGGGKTWLFDARNIHFRDYTMITTSDPYNGLIQVRGDGAITIENVNHTTSCLVEPVGDVPNLVQRNNQRIPMPSLDPPVIKAQQVGNKIAVEARGAQRIYFFVDDLLMKVADDEKVLFDIPTDLTSGQHEISIRAIDALTNMSPPIKLAISI